MHIIPASPYNTNSTAEYRVFEKIRESFVNDTKYFAFHSLNLTKHKSKRFGEADFVIVCEYGVFVFEVKGGRISSHNGLWYTIDRGDIKHQIQDPFRQSEGALHAIKNEVISSNKFIGLNIPIGYGVIFPDVEWSQASSEWDNKIICDSKKFRNFESWLEKFFRYWYSKPGNIYKLSSKEIAKIKQYLRPNFELVEPLHVQLSRLEDAAVKLTDEQYRYLDIVSANKQVLCSGGAGTGKTFLAAELSRRLGCSDKRVVLVCKSNWLKRYLETRIQNENVVISTIDSAKVDKRRAGIDKYDVLIVDEGQDLFDFDYIDILDSMLNGGMEEGGWYIFHDINNQSGLFIDTKLEVLEIIESYNPVYVPLTINCRNSCVILNKIQSTLHLDMGNKGTGLGPEVHETHVTANDSTEVLENEINQLLKSGVSADEITILSPLSYEKSTVSTLSTKLKKQIIKLDDFLVRSISAQGIGFAEIKNFKGLENEVIIVIDLINPISIQNVADKVLHYVAMSRARSLLCVLWNT